MGNCVSSKYLCGKSSKISDEEALEMVKRSLMAYDGSPRYSTEVKIKITKRELEKLLDNFKVVEVKEELPTSLQFLSRLIHIDGVLEMQPRSWQPSLQSIPELD